MVIGLPHGMKAVKRRRQSNSELVGTHADWKMKFEFLPDGARIFGALRNVTSLGEALKQMRHS